MDVKTALKQMSEAQAFLRKAFPGFDSRDDFDDMTDKFWSMSDYGGLIVGDSAEAVRYGVWAEGDSMDEESREVFDYWSMHALNDDWDERQAVGFMAFVIDHEDGHGSTISIFDCSKKVEIKLVEDKDGAEEDDADEDSDVDTAVPVVEVPRCRFCNGEMNLTGSRSGNLEQKVFQHYECMRKAQQ